MARMVNTGNQICDDVRKLHVESVAYWMSFTTSAFTARIGDAWSPAENVRHLTKSIKAVSRGLHMPRLLLRVAFGKANRPSCSLQQIIVDYRAALAKGGTAGKFAPSDRPATVNPDAERARIMDEHAQAVTDFCSAAAGWTENALDDYRLPHPLLGALTVREMLLFTLYHNRHHVDNVRRYLAASADGGRV